MKKIIITASYGGANFGDEAILESIIKMIYEVGSEFKITVLAWDKNKVAKLHKIFFKQYKISIAQAVGGKFQLKQPFNYLAILKSFYLILNCDYFIWGGGGIINDEGFYLPRYLISLRLARFFKKKIFIFAIGAKMISDSRYLKIIQRCFNYADIISVRDEQSKKNLIMMRVNKKIEVLPDPVFLLNQANFNQNGVEGTCKIGINLRPWFNRVIHKNEDRYKLKVAIKNLARVFVQLKQEKIDFTLYAFPFDSDKDEMTIKILNGMLPPDLKINFMDRPSDLDELNKKLKKIDIFVGMRLHSIIFAFNAGKPFFIISYTEKTKNLIKILDWEDFSIDIESLASPEFNPGILANKFKILISDRNKFINILSVKRQQILVAAGNYSILIKKFIYG